MIDADIRIDRLEAQAAIARLSSDYCLFCDTRQLADLVALFATDAEVAIPAFDVGCRGAADIARLYAAQFAGLGFSNHWTNDIVIDFAGDDDATGRVAAHAEVVVADVACLAAMHYDDRYIRQSDGWRFRSRVVNFLFYAPMSELAYRLVMPDRVKTAAGWVPGYQPATRG